MSLADCSPIIVAEDQDRRHDHFAQQLQHFNAPAVPGKYTKVDINWTVNGQPVMFDVKTPLDFVQSHQDERLHNQMRAMKEANCLVMGIYLVGDWNEYCGRDEDTFDNMLARIQHDGADIIRVRSPEHAARRLASFWRYTRDSLFDKEGSYHIPERIIPSNDMTRDPPLIFWDSTFRSQVGMLMHLPNCGAVTANTLREQHPLMQCLGITEEGLETAKGLWLATKGIGKKTAEQWETYIRS
jgi:ERCC4-type nuclease